MPTIHEQLSKQFFRWEQRGRGWQTFDEPVFPEPPFVPFHGHSLPDTPTVDNGRRDTFLSSLWRKVSAPTPQPVTVAEPETEPLPETLIREPLTELQIVLPAELKSDTHLLERFFSTLSFCKEPISFELFGISGRVTLQFTASADDAPLLQRQLEAHFPEAQIKTCKDALAQAWVTCSGEESLVIEFGLAREFMYSLANGNGDPFVGLVGALSKLQADELGLFQVLWQPARHNWPENIMCSVTDSEGKPFFVNVPELTAAAEQKIAKPLFAAVVRIATKAQTFEQAVQIASDMGGALRAFADPQGNQLIPLKNDVETYHLDDHIADMLFRQTRRSGMILNSEELAGFVHLPSDEVRSPILVRDTGGSRAVPGIVGQPDGIVIGDNEHLGEVVPVYLTADQRVRHTHIVGSSGYGKSSLLFNMVQQDIENGDGVAVLDPHGDLIDQLLGIIPDSRIDDVILVDASDTEFPVGFNILQAHSEEEKNLLASDLIAVFRRLSTSWGDQMDAVMQNAILAFLNSTRGGSLKDLQRFLADKPPFRKEFLKTVQDPEVVEFWENIFPQLSGGKSIPSVLTRLQEFFARKTLRNMVSQPKNKLDFGNIMDSGKIFLAKLPEGLCGEENSYLLGTLLVSKFQQLAMARQSQEAGTRRNFWLYIDEFDHFITPSMAKILTRARKYRLGLTLAHQQLHQLESDPKVAAAVISQPCTRIVFRVDDSDAKRLGDGFESFEAKHLKTLEKFHALARVERNDFDFNLAIRKPEFPDQQATDTQRQKAITASRTKYATPRAEVEAALSAAIEKPRLPEAQPIVPPPQSTMLPVQVAPLPSEPKPVVEVSKAVEIPKPAEAQPPVKREPPRDLGRGGEQHKAIQQRIKKAAEGFGFRSTIEKTVLDGLGSIDLFLERDGQNIACEISLTTTIDHEVGNVSKCLKAGVPAVAVICLDDERLRKMEQAVTGSLGAEATAQVRYFQPDPFIAHLKQLKSLTPQPSETSYGGYKVKRSVPKLSPQERRQKEDLANRIIAEAMRGK